MEENSYSSGSSFNGAKRVSWQAELQRSEDDRLVTLARLSPDLWSILHLPRGSFRGAKQALGILLSFHCSRPSRGSRQTPEGRSIAGLDQTLHFGSGDACAGAGSTACDAGPAKRETSWTWETPLRQESPPSLKHLWINLLVIGWPWLDGW